MMLLKKRYQNFYSKWIALVVMCMGFLGCQSQPTVYETPLPAVPVADVYRLGAGDTLAINVWRNPELSATMPIRPDGKVALALIGDVQAAGLTVTEFSESLNQALIRYVRNPQVTVLLMDSVSADFQHRIRVTGAVNSQQSIPHRDGMTVLDVVLMAGGPNDFAVGNKAKLYRNTLEGLKVYDIRLDDILEKGILDTNYQLQPLDIITVPERFF